MLWFDGNACINKVVGRYCSGNDNKQAVIYAAMII